jgi:hypothetical protein
MFNTPDATPVTTPVAEPTVARVVLPLIQVPPLVASDSVITLPTHTVLLPVTEVGGAFTVTTLVTVPVPVMYEMVATPAATPFTTPLVAPTVATAVLLLVQLPPEVESVSVAVEPTHIADGPEIALIANDDSDKKTPKRERIKNFFI